MDYDLYLLANPLHLVKDNKKLKNNNDLLLSLNKSFPSYNIINLSDNEKNLLLNKIQNLIKNYIIDLTVDTFIQDLLCELNG